VNLACWDGKVSEHWQREEHPLDKTAGKGRVAGAPAKMEAAPATANRESETVYSGKDVEI
jgi:hypothetical protein